MTALMISADIHYQLSTCRASLDGRPSLEQPASFPDRSLFTLIPFITAAQQHLGSGSIDRCVSSARHLPRSSLCALLPMIQNEPMRNAGRRLARERYRQKVEKNFAKIHRSMRSLQVKESPRSIDSMQRMVPSWNCS